MSAYAISKAAVTRLTENLAAETEAHGISVFALHPGSVRTAAWEIFLSDAAKKYLPDLHNYVLQGGGSVTLERAAELVLFLASGQADALSGCFISVDDDVAEMVQRAEEIQHDELHTLRLRT
jgi:NAD(P)-dependent dehydrogenase (short-subunit alcohol dehydrogenase family)